jgi:LysM repeat protein
MKQSGKNTRGCASTLNTLMANARWIIAATVIALIAGAGCASIGDDDSKSSVEGATATAEPNATLPPMRIVTPTPVDPLQIPGTATGTPENVSVPETYVVQEGDSLYSIAARFQVALADIVALNGLSDPNDISVGQELRLPVPEQP